MKRSGAPGQVITFYSYKGGTGRTMALANVACLLAQQRDRLKPVLAIDWDLEAPGLHLFFRDLLAKETKETEGGKNVESISNSGEGLIDLLIEFRRRIEESNPGSIESETQQTEEGAAELLKGIDFGRYVRSTRIPNLHLLTAGRFDEAYSRRVNTFDWERLYNRSPWIFQSFADFLSERYDYVLIDSRTGRTDTGNICTMLMPQKLVVVFTPNRQSLTGVEDLVRQAITYRRRSDDIRPLLVYPLPTRIENSEPERREQWRFGDEGSSIVGYQATFERIFKEAYALPKCDLARYFDAVQVQHVPSYAYGEEIATLTERATDVSSLHFRFKTFCDWIVAAAAPWESPDVASDKERELAQQLEEEKKKSAEFGGIFVSYSHKDKKWAETLLAHLAPLSQLGVEIWTDQRIKPGEKWHKEIQKRLDAAQVAVLLVSPDYLNSAYIKSEELPKMLAASASKGLAVTWIPVSASNWEESEIAQFQAALDP